MLPGRLLLAASANIGLPYGEPVNCATLVARTLCALYPHLRPFWSDLVIAHRDVDRRWSMIDRLLAEGVAVNTSKVLGVCVSQGWKTGDMSAGHQWFSWPGWVFEATNLPPKGYQDGVVCWEGYMTSYPNTRTVRLVPPEKGLI